MDLALDQCAYLNGVTNTINVMPDYGLRVGKGPWKGRDWWWGNCLLNFPDIDLRINVYIYRERVGICLTKEIHSGSKKSVLSV